MVVSLLVYLLAEHQSVARFLYLYRYIELLGQLEWTAGRMWR